MICPAGLCSATRHAVPCLLMLGWLAPTGALSGTPEEEALFSPEGYRISQFRAPVPASLPGTYTVDTRTVQALIAEGGIVLIDVMPAPQKPENRPPGSLWLPPPRRNIPGSTWLPNVGFGRLSDELEVYFKNNLQQLSGGDRDKKIVIYCLADCWMSWNAAKRAAEYGYTEVRWYPEGTTGWEASGLPLTKATAVPQEKH